LFFSIASERPAIEKHVCSACGFTVLISINSNLIIPAGWQSILPKADEFLSLPPSQRQAYIIFLCVLCGEYVISMSGIKIGSLSEKTADISINVWLQIIAIYTGLRPGDI